MIILHQSHRRQGDRMCRSQSYQRLLHPGEGRNRNQSLGGHPCCHYWDWRSPTMGNQTLEIRMYHRAWKATWTYRRSITHSKATLEWIWLLRGSNIVSRGGGRRLTICNRLHCTILATEAFRVDGCDGRRGCRSRRFLSGIGGWCSTSINIRGGSLLCSPLSSMSTFPQKSINAI